MKWELSGLVCGPGSEASVGSADALIQETFLELKYIRKTPFITFEKNI